MRGPGEVQLPAGDRRVRHLRAGDPKIEGLTFRHSVRERGGL